MKDKELAKLCEEYFDYAYKTAAIKYGSYDEIDVLVQEAMLAFVMQIRKGEEVEYPKAFLDAVLRNKYNSAMRRKYRNSIISFDEIADLNLQAEEPEEETFEEYEAVRRELGRLAKIYRDVAVLYYVHGKTTEEIARELGIPRGTVHSRLSEARNTMREGIENMEKYSKLSYEPKKVRVGIWGSAGIRNEPFSLFSSDIEGNILCVAYEKPVSARDIADTLGIPCAYIEPILENLVEGEVMGKTAGGLFYTRCYVENYEDSFGDIPAQEALAAKYAKEVWRIAEECTKELRACESFCKMTDKQKATLLLSILNQGISGCTIFDKTNTKPPERPNMGSWILTCTVYNEGERKCEIAKYERSGPVYISYGESDKDVLCKMRDFQSCFGEAHWGYTFFKYKFNLNQILRFYASFLPCGVKSENSGINEVIPDFERPHILRREENGEIALDIPALTFEEEKKYADPAILAIKKKIIDLMGEELFALWEARKNNVPKHVDACEHFEHSGALYSFSIAQLLAITKSGVMPYKVEIGKTPLIYVTYKPKQA